MDAPPVAVSVRRLRPWELDEVCRAFPERPRMLHLGRLILQAQDELRYLIAWDGPRPVGHVVVQVPERSRQPMEMAWREGCAEIGDLFVDPAHRRGGAGRALVLAAEDAARAFGGTRVGLATGPGDGFAAARALYASLGYRDAGHGPYLEGWVYRDEWGEVRTSLDPLVYLVKDLP